MTQGETKFINGDGEISRDFCNIINPVQANLLAAVSTNSDTKDQVYIVAIGDRTTLNQRFDIIQIALKDNGINYIQESPCCEPRNGDIRLSKVGVNKAKILLGYEVCYRVLYGVSEAMPLYKKFYKRKPNNEYFKKSA